MSESIESILLRLGFDATSVKIGTDAMMQQQKKAAQEYGTWWETAMERKVSAETNAAKKAAEQVAQIENEANNASFNRYKANMLNKERLDREWMENKAAMADIARGSGGYGSTTSGAGRSGRSGSSGTAGLLAAQVISDHTTGSGWGAAFKGAGATLGLLEIQRAINETVRGKMPKSLRMLSRAFLHVGEFISEFAKVIAPAAAAIFAAWQVVRTTRAGVAAGQARQGEAFSSSDLATQTGKLGGSLDAIIDQMQASGRITGAQADILRRATSGGNADRLRVAQRFLLTEESKTAKEKADLEQKAAEAADYAQRAAEGKAAAEKKATDELKEQQRLNKQYDTLAREAHRIEHDIAGIEREAPTIAQLAGRGYQGRLKAYFGAGGPMDLESGNGPGARAAQDYQYFQNKQIYDREQGNTNAADFDRQRMIALKGELTKYGLESDSMKFEDMRAHLEDIRTSMSNLLKGSPIKTELMDE